MRRRSYIARVVSDAKRPALIARCRGVADVAAAVNLARETHRPPESDDYVPMDNAERRLTAQELKAFLLLLRSPTLHVTGDDVKPRYPMPRWGWASRR